MKSKGRGGGWWVGVGVWGGGCLTILCEMGLKGSFTIFLFLVRSHILNRNGVWYW